MDPASIIQRHDTDAGFHLHDNVLPRLLIRANDFVEFDLDITVGIDLAALKDFPGTMNPHDRSSSVKSRERDYQRLTEYSELDTLRVRLANGSATGVCRSE
jgi:hypothetical protein